MDGLKAVNVYTIETADGLTLVDGGWAIEAAREVLVRCLRQLGAGLGDIRRFLVTHAHRDHFTMAAVLGAECGATVALGADEKPALDLIHSTEKPVRNPFARALVMAGAADLAAQWDYQDDLDPEMWRLPDSWLDGDQSIPVGNRTLEAIHTPGHTPGHYVFADQSSRLLFAGDHVLPTITPSIGFMMPLPSNPLWDYLASLTKVRAMPDLRLLSAHGPVAPSTHERVDELLSHHDHRLAQTLAALTGGPATAFEVAQHLGWTRHQRPFDGLDVFNQGMAIMETAAHLELLVARRHAKVTHSTDGTVVFTRLGQA